MGAFDGHILQVAEFLTLIRNKRGTKVTEQRWPGSPERLLDELPVRVGVGANRARLILRGDTYLELGGPDAGSCSVVLWTDDPTLVADGRITLVGPDVGESDTKRLPFGQVLLVGGSDLAIEDHADVQQIVHVADHIEGYMVRSTSECLWCRISNEAAAKGFKFDTLGRALLHRAFTATGKITAAEVAFVTTGREHLQSLSLIAAGAKATARELTRDLWKARGFDLDCDLHCGPCPERRVCDDLKEVASMRRRQRESLTRGATT